MPRHFNQVRGERHHNARLTEKDVAQMRFLHHEDGLCIRCVAMLYGVRYATAWEAICYRTWKHVA